MNNRGGIGHNRPVPKFDRENELLIEENGEEIELIKARRWKYIFRFLFCIIFF